MQYVGRFVSSVYNTITPNINPATLSGAIDVIVVEREVEVEEEVSDDDGQAGGFAGASPRPKRKRKRKTTELASTPFHVRFGKMSVLRPAERKVTLHLNGSTEPLPFAMKVGEQGEAFFIVEIDDEDGKGQIPDDLVTSPILSATTSPVTSPDFVPANATGETRATSINEVEPLDLGDSRTSPMAAVTQPAVPLEGAHRLVDTAYNDDVAQPSDSDSVVDVPPADDVPGSDEVTQDVPPKDSVPSGSGPSAGPSSLLGQLGTAASKAGGAIGAAGRAVAVKSSSSSLEKLAKKSSKDAISDSTGAPVDEDKKDASQFSSVDAGSSSKDTQVAHGDSGSPHADQSPNEAEQLEEAMNNRASAFLDQVSSEQATSASDEDDARGSASPRSIEEEAYPAPFGSQHTLSGSAKIRPSRASSNTFPVAQMDHGTYLAGKKLEGLVPAGEAGVEPAQVNALTVEGRLKSGNIPDAEAERSSDAADHPPTTPQKSSRLKEDLQYMLDMDGYKMTADGEDLAFAEGNRLAHELPLSRRHGGDELHPHIGELLDQAHRRNNDRRAGQADATAHANGDEAQQLLADKVRTQDDAASDDPLGFSSDTPPFVTSGGQIPQEDMDLSRDLARVARSLRSQGEGITDIDNEERTTGNKRRGNRSRRAPQDASLSDTEAGFASDEEGSGDIQSIHRSHHRAKSGPFEFSKASMPGDATPPESHEQSMDQSSPGRPSSMSYGIDRSEPTPRPRVLSSAAADQMSTREARGRGLGHGPRFTVSDSNPYQFRLVLDGEISDRTFEMSLCFKDGFGSDPDGGAAHGLSDDERDEFEENRISFQRFVDDPDVVNDERLVVLYNGRYLTWENASAVLATLSLYRNTFASHSAQQEVPLERPVPPQGVRASVWSRWWNRNRQLEEADGGRPGLPRESSAPPEEIPSGRPGPGMERAHTDTEILAPVSAGAEASNDPEPVRKPKTQQKTYAKTLRLTSDQLKSLNLQKGANTITFSVTSSYSGVATCTARIFLWESSHHIVVSDIDGTITKSDALGHVFTMIGRDWTHIGVAKLYTDIARNGYRIMYLTSRAIGQADTTRDYLRGISQNNYRLPDGPVIMSPDRLIASLHREVILRKPEVFKMACLRDIARLFGADPRHAQPQPGGQLPTGAEDHALQKISQPGAGAQASPAAGAATAAHTNPTPFYAGFGNRITDALSYRSVNIPSSRIFTIDTNGEVKMELLELAGYKSSYIHMTDLVDQMFPPITQRTSERNAGKPEYNDFNYWRPQISDFDLPRDDELLPSPPVSPALSARSGRSVRSTGSARSNTTMEGEQQQSRLSRFGLGSLGLSRKGSTQSMAEPLPNGNSGSSQHRPNHSQTAMPDMFVPAGTSGSVSGQQQRHHLPESMSAPDLSLDHTSPHRAQSAPLIDGNSEAGSSSDNLMGTSPPAGTAGYGQASSSWIAPWRRRAVSPSSYSSSGSVSGGASPPQATSPLVGPVITAEPDSDDEYDDEGEEGDEDDDDDDVSSFEGNDDEDDYEDEDEDEDEELEEDGEGDSRQEEHEYASGAAEQRTDAGEENSGHGQGGDAGTKGPVDRVRRKRRGRQGTMRQNMPIDDMGDDVLEDDVDELLATGEVQFDWKG